MFRASQKYKSEPRSRHAPGLFCATNTVYTIGIWRHETTPHLRLANTLETEPCVAEADYERLSSGRDEIAQGRKHEPPPARLTNAAGRRRSYKREDTGSAPPLGRSDEQQSELQSL